MRVTPPASGVPRASQQAAWGGVHQGWGPLTVVLGVADRWRADETEVRPAEKFVSVVL